MSMLKSFSSTGLFRPDLILDMNVFSFSSIPDLDLERLLKKRHTRVQYFQGSLMNTLDMERVKVKLKTKTSINLLTTGA